MDCIYCQLGPSPKKRVGRKELVPVRQVLAQIKRALAGGQKIDCLTFSGSGEPTLHSGLGRIIAGIKRITAIPVVVLTNSSLLSSPKTRRDLRAADIVVPSLDAVTPSVFAKVNRPHPSLNVAKIIDGLVRFRKEYKGQIWLEVMLVEGVNDGLSHFKKLKDAIALIKPDKVQLNTVVRPPAEKFARALSIARARKNQILPRADGRDHRRFQDKRPGSFGHGHRGSHPVDGQTPADDGPRHFPIAGEIAGRGPPTLVRLVRQRRLKKKIHEGSAYYEPF